MNTDSEALKERIRDRYGAIAETIGKMNPTAERNAAETLPPLERGGCCGSSEASCCGPSEAIDCVSDGVKLTNDLYEDADLTDLPDTVTDVSLGCGNPTAIASLKSGETVLDLGSGGGIDCFLAAKAVGADGYVIGVDMTDRMLALANENKLKLGITNVEFRKGEIEDLPVRDETIDCIISNCVINLSPDKSAVFREAFRVLKRSGRFTVSDIVSEGDIPEPLLSNINAWVGCVSGALDQTIYLEKLRQAGFSEVVVESRQSYGIENLSDLDEATREALTKDVDLSTVPTNARIYSANIVAYKR